MTMNPKDRLIVALDLPNAIEALDLVRTLGDDVTFYKVGLGMLTGGGLALADELTGMGKRVFLDMKLFDIPATVTAAVRGLCQYDLDLLTVHGDPHVVEAAVAGRGSRATRILGVAVLTSLNRADLDAAMMAPGDITEFTIERARRALVAGADGVIVSPHEATLVRGLAEAAGKLVVTPGVRPTGSSRDDQKRVATPAEAISAGADHIVVGRPVWQAADPVATARAIQADLAAL